MRRGRCSLLVSFAVVLVGCDRSAEVAFADPPLDPIKGYPTIDGVAIKGDVVVAAPLRDKVDNLIDKPLDVVLLDTAGKRFIVLKNSGGSFDAANTTVEMLGAKPVSAATLDINDDGALDLAIATIEEPRLMLLLNDGSGKFSLSSKEHVLPERPVRLIAAQFDDVCHDAGAWIQGAKTDLAVATAGGSGSVVTIYRNVGNGNFIPAYAIEVDRGAAGTGVLPDDVDSGDVDGDKDIDIIVAAGSNRSSAVRVLLNRASQGGDGFDTGGMIPLIGPGGVLRATSIRTVELNGDNACDLLIATGKKPGALVALNAGGIAGGWRGFGSAWTPNYALDPANLAIAGTIYDGPGWITGDVILLPGSGDKGRFYDNDTDLSTAPSKLSFKAEETLALGAAGLKSATIGDVTGDQRPDLILPTGYFPRKP